MIETFAFLLCAEYTEYEIVSLTYRKLVFSECKKFRNIFFKISSETKLLKNNINKSIYNRYNKFYTLSTNPSLKVNAFSLIAHHCSDNNY